MFMEFHISFLKTSLRFRNKQDENVTGISKSAKVFRKRRNLVSMRFNLMNWLLEAISLILASIGENIFWNFLYLLLNSIGTPLVVQPTFVVCYMYFYQSYFLGLLSGH